MKYNCAVRLWFVGALRIVCADANASHSIGAGSEALFILLGVLVVCLAGVVAGIFKIRSLQKKEYTNYLDYIVVAVLFLPILAVSLFLIWFFNV